MKASLRLANLCFFIQSTGLLSRLFKHDVISRRFEYCTGEIEIIQSKILEIVNRYATKIFMPAIKLKRLGSPNQIDDDSYFKNVNSIKIVEIRSDNIEFNRKSIYLSILLIDGKQIDLIGIWSNLNQKRHFLNQKRRFLPNSTYFRLNSTNF